MTNPNGQTTDASDLSPEQRLEPPNTRLINAGIVTINDMETLRECIAYENTHQNRTPILKRLDRKAAELQDAAEN